MKKNFVEPELVRIDLKMTENIATSQQERFFSIREGMLAESGMFVTRQYMDGCKNMVAYTEPILTFPDVQYPNAMYESVKVQVYMNCSVWSPGIKVEY